MKDQSLLCLCFLCPQLQFFIVTIHTAFNLYADCDFPDSMNMVVFGYALSLIALFSNFYYQSYLSKKTKILWLHAHTLIVWIKMYHPLIPQTECGNCICLQDCVILPLSQIHLSVYSPLLQTSPYNLYTPIPLWSLGIETLQRSSDLAKLK